ncbi:MAG: AAA family ATPase [Gammaproteobacteria bacterium]|nr:AAA family ATPase [Gammaproteobacteria bacterium]
MYVTTFYSFKGGVGRTMALVNTAVNLAMGGRRVLVVDFDIEAPGLDTFDVLKPREEVPGVIDFVTQYRKSGQSPDASGFIGECPLIGDQNGKLWIMPSGRNETYAANFNQIDWSDLYEKHDGFLLFEDLRAQWQQILKPEYVLIDSRTGHTDTSGICTRQLPDAVVVLFFPNEQNLRGLIDVVSDIRDENEGYRKNIELHFVMSNVPDLDDGDQILENKIKAFQERLNFRQEPMVVHRYDSLSLLNQVVFSKDRPKSRLADEYRKIVHEISVRNWNDRDGALEYIRRVDKPWRWNESDSILRQEEMLDKIEQAHPTDGEVLFRLGELKESHRDLESALLLINRAIDAGYDRPAAFLKRSRIREQDQDSDGANEDAWRLLKLQNVPPPMVREAISRLTRMEASEKKEIIKCSAVLSLNIEDKIWLANALNRSKDDMLLGVRLFEQILDVNELSETHRDSVRCQLGLSYMRLGRCLEAKSMFRREGEKLADMDIQDAFNYAMAEWGVSGTIETDLFQCVVKLDRSNPNEDANPNYLQCMAIACWASGDHGTALDYAKRTQHAVNSFPGRTEFSAWRYQQVSLEIFATDLDEILSLIEGRGSPVPKFMSVTGNTPINV